MANPLLAERSAFAPWTPIKHANITIEVRENLTLASVAAARGKTREVADLMRAAYGVECPLQPICAHGTGSDGTGSDGTGSDGTGSAGALSMMWAGPDQWLAFAERTVERDLERELKAQLGANAAVVDQSDARVFVRVSGPRARDVLAKGVPIDLHASVFKTDSVAITSASHIGVIIHQVDDQPTYDIAMFRSFADSFMRWLVESAAEFTH